ARRTCRKTRRLPGLKCQNGPTAREQDARRKEPRERTMSDAAVQLKPSGEAEREMTDGFHLIIDALKLNGITTIYGVPGIPITDFGRMAQAPGIGLISFPPPQNAGD